MGTRSVVKQENVLKAKCLQLARVELRGYVILSHQDVRKNGYPDATTTSFGRTSWWEFKHATPDFDSPGIQELTMLRLAHAGFARYVIYHEDKNGQSKRTLIVHPKRLSTLDAEEWCVGFNHQFVINYMRKVHEPLQ